MYNYTIMKTLRITTQGWSDIIDITELIQKEVKKEKFETGLICLFVLGSTASLTTIEADENLYQDLKEFLERIIPYQKNYHHHQTWGDDNGAAHLRATLFGPSLTIPIKNGRLYLGIWQRVVLLDFDTRGREREIVISFIKEND